MKKKYIVIGLTCVFLVITGVCYSCAYHDKTSAVLVTSMTDKIPAVDAQNTATTLSENQSVSDTVTIAATAQEQEEEKANIYVHICGAIVNPGVYQVETGARLVKLIEISGGLTKEAAGDYINQAQLVTDGQRIYIPTRKELRDLTAAEYQAGDQKSSRDPQKTALVNINAADAEELMSLPGIGQAKADSIIAYRTTNGKFKAIEDLMNIPGIKEGLFSKISSKITVY